MNYEGSIGLGTEQIKKKIADLNFLGLFMEKQHVLSDKKIPSVTRRCRNLSRH
jgi:hypothetical protein